MNIHDRHVYITWVYVWIQSQLICIAEMEWTLLDKKVSRIRIIVILKKLLISFISCWLEDINTR